MALFTPEERLEMIVRENYTKEIARSRYIASWINAGGKFYEYRNDDAEESTFEEWLRTLEFEERDGTITKLTDREIREIYQATWDGKFEFEQSARAFLEKT